MAPIITNIKDGSQNLHIVKKPYILDILVIPEKSNPIPKCIPQNIERINTLNEGVLKALIIKNKEYSIVQLKQI